MTPQRIKRLRTQLGWSQQQMGRHFGYSSVAVLKWEKGQTEPPDMVKATLTQIERELDKRKQKQKQQDFINGLAATAITGGLIALLGYVFKEK